MVGFVRRDIPSMTNERLIAECAYNKEMRTVVYKQELVGIRDKKIKSYNYYDTNLDLISNELDRRIRDKEGIWCGALDLYMTVEDAKQMLRINIVEKKKSIRGLTEADANAIMVNWNEDLKYLEGQLQRMLETYPDDA